MEKEKGGRGGLLDNKMERLLVMVILYNVLMQFMLRSTALHWLRYTLCFVASTIFLFFCHLFPLFSISPV